MRARVTIGTPWPCDRAASAAQRIRPTLTQKLSLRLDKAGQGGARLRARRDGSISLSTRDQCGLADAGCGREGLRGVHDEHDQRQQIS